MEVEQKKNAPYECITSSVEIHVEIFKRLLQNDQAGEEYLQMRLTTEGRKLVQISNQQVMEIKLLERPLISALMRDSGLHLIALYLLGDFTSGLAAFVMIFIFNKSSFYCENQKIP